MAICPSRGLHRCLPSSSSSDGAVFFSQTVHRHGAPSSTRRPQSLAIRAGNGQPAFAHSIVLHTVATPDVADLGHAPQKPSAKLADMLGSIASLYSEAGEEKRVAAECVERTVEESGRTAEDYGRRALLFEQSGEMAASSKLKGDRLMEELETLQGDILESDEGRSAADYLCRAELFSKSAEIFGGKSSEMVLP